MTSVSDMGTLAAVLLCVAVFVYVEAGIFTGVYMYLKTSQGQQDKKEDKKELIGYSILAGIAFPITFAILAAYRAAERKGN